MPRMKSDRYGEHPFGTHWTPGKVREVSDADAADAPKWLKPAPAKKASKKTKTPEPEATTEG